MLTEQLEYTAAICLAVPRYDVRFCRRERKHLSDVRDVCVCVCFFFPSLWL